jgi:hypothetical protein
MEFTSVDTYQVTIGAGVTTIDASNRGGSTFVLKNPNASGGNVMYIGPATNRAAAALSSTTGFKLSGGESISLNLTGGSETAAEELSVSGTQNDILHVLVLHP